VSLLEEKKEERRPRKGTPLRERRGGNNQLLLLQREKGGEYGQAHEANEVFPSGKKREKETFSQTQEGEVSGRLGLTFVHVGRAGLQSYQSPDAGRGGGEASLLYLRKDRGEKGRARGKVG